MKRQKMIKLKKWHRWLGLTITIFLFFCILSGWILGHRLFFADTDLPRRLLPGEYQYENWNNASARGSIRIGRDSVLLYGGIGVWQTDSAASRFTPRMEGMKPGADNRTVSRLVRTSDGSLFAATTFRLYRMAPGGKEWQEIPTGVRRGERLSDVEVRGDTLVLLSRSHLFQSLPPYEYFNKYVLSPPPGYNGRMGLFRFIWILHSGELFGEVGVWVVSILGALLMVLVVTGFLFFLFPYQIRRRKKKSLPVGRQAQRVKQMLHWHNRIGSKLWVFLLLMALTGAFLRPPLLIAIVRGSVPPIPGTLLADDNPWNDKLRVIRYDRLSDGWMLYTSRGFYWMEKLGDMPMPLRGVPPVSVMGANVFEAVPGGWLVGSFNGLYHWNVYTGMITDVYAGNPAVAPPASRPITAHPISGYSGDFPLPVIFEYGSGAITSSADSFRFPPMPTEIADGRISLWHVALETHTGRILFGVLGPLADIYVTLLGLTTAFLLLSGYIIYRRQKRRKNNK